MKPFVEWVKDPGFHISRSLDPVDGWIAGGMLRLYPHQERILGHCLTPDEKGHLPYTTVIYSCPKKSGKTTIAAAVAAWYAEEGMEGSEIYCLANDLEQAQSRVYMALDYHNRTRGEPEDRSRLKYVTYYDNGTTVHALASEYRSIAGAHPSLTTFDELWGYTSEASRRLWAEMTIPPTVKAPLRFISTYAGHIGESDLLWDLYERAVKNGEPVKEFKDFTDDRGHPVCWKNGKTFAYWDHTPRMPWQTEEYYDNEIASGMRPVDFLRLHRNEWVTSDEAFIDISLWDKAVDRGSEIGLTEPILYKEDFEYRDHPISVSVDAATTHDCSAVIGCYYDSKRGRVGLAFHKIWIPPKRGTLDFEETIEKFILMADGKCNIRLVTYDPTQMHRSMTTLGKSGIRVEQFPQTNANMTAATQNLYDLLTEGRIESYPAADLREHLRFSVAQNTGRGFKITKERHAKYKIDGAVALAMAAYHAVKFAGVDLTKPIQIYSPFSDQDAKKPPPGYFEKNRKNPLGDQTKLPQELRTDI